MVLQVLLLIAGILTLVLLVFLYFLFDYLKQLRERLSETDRRQDDLWRSISGVLQKNTADLNMRLDRAVTVIASVQKNIGEMSEIGRSMKDLQEYLTSPKLRGSIGEEVLSEVLHELLPKDLFSLQHSFKAGEKVDAVVRIGKQLVPIDAKFPIENFRKMNEVESKMEKDKYKKLFIADVKKHIDDISRKYILTDEGTTDYALMYVPAESVYYEIIRNEKLSKHGRDKRVLFVSPMSLYAYLKAILMSYQGQTIQKKAQEILQLLRSTQKDYEKIEESLGVLEKHFNYAYNQLQNVNKLLAKLGQKLITTKMLEAPENE